MKTYKINIRTQGGFYTPIKGDMLFGMFCRLLADCLGEERLRACLEGYEDNRPFVVFSDAFPRGFLPKPCLPGFFYTPLEKKEDVSKRKEIKRKIWLPADKIGLPTQKMADFFAEKNFLTRVLKTSNRTDPASSRVSGGKYSAYTTEQIFYNDSPSIYMVVDESRISVSEVGHVLTQVGLHGYGKKASAGGGKFILEGEAEEIKAADYPYNGFMTLAPCVPQTELLDKERCFYKIFTRFGRHGGTEALSPNPFKKPVITLETGAFLSFIDKAAAPSFAGRGLRGTSLVNDATVFQGYAPLVPVFAEECLK